jgi:thiol:disulfide interchange protein DsbG
MLSTLRLALSPLLAVLALGAPADAAEPWSGGGAQTRMAVPRPGWDDLEHAKWIADGRDDAPRRIYVFMDANCKYCTKLWTDARPWIAGGQVQLRYLMVAVISPTSGGKAAAILADKDPARRLDAYERAHSFGVARMLAGGPHHALSDPNLLPMDPIPAALGDVLAANERLMAGLSLSGTPGIVFRSANGQVATRAGLDPVELPLILGPR